MRRSAAITLLVALCLIPSPLLADNCGSLGDCYNTLRAALAALVGVATLAMLLSLGLDLLPFIGSLKGIIQAATGKDLITGEKLEDWERALGAIPGGAWAKLGGKLGKLEDLRGLGRAEGRLSNEEVRVWYSSQVKAIDTSGPLTKETAARVNAERNSLKQTARDMMADREVAEQLAKEQPIRSLEHYIEKYSKEGYEGDALWKRIIEGGTTPNSAVDQKFGLD